eukprot:594459-Pyramimonas_sp.AAC.1
MGQDWIQKARGEPQKENKSPTHWGPYECLYCVSKAYARFREHLVGTQPSERHRAHVLLAEAG